jgi:hypothetical protein|tara:strand:- start:347 stop:541 length:195 start_codon:yes stop_codon:yes gene_type:complete
MNNVKLTSVKVLKDLYKKFKLTTLDDSFTLQKLVNRSMDLYVHDNDFKEQINEWQNLKPSGSKL